MQTNHQYAAILSSMVSKKKPEKLAQKRWTQNISFHTGALFYFS